MCILNNFVCPMLLHWQELDQYTCTIINEIWDNVRVMLQLGLESGLGLVMESVNCQVYRFPSYKYLNIIH